MEADVIIIGAGMAGLSTALELKSHKIQYTILEAQDAPGGRAASIHTKSGLAVDMGAHWFHDGEHNPLKELLNKYEIEYRMDKNKNMWVYENGKGKKVDPDWLEELVDPKKAKHIQNSGADYAAERLAKNKPAKEKLELFTRMWTGLNSGLELSAKGFLSDKSKPGGLQVSGGVGLLIAAMIKEIGKKNIQFKCKVSEIKSIDNGVEVRALGKIYRAKYAVFTGSLGVIKSNLIKFKPSLSKEMRHNLSKISMGNMNKIIVEIKPEFFELMQIEDDLALELLDGDWPHFCHVKSAGNPLISLFISGPRAKKIEKFTSQQALEYLRKVLKPVNQLLGYDQFIIGKPIITKWFGNPYIKGCYSAPLPYGEYSWPRQEGNTIFAGDSFDKQYPGAMAGAYRSGKVAALMIKEKLAHSSSAG